MRAGLVGAVITLMLLLGVLLLADGGDPRAQGWETVRLAIDAPNTIVLERDARQYALEMARVETQRAQALAQERTLRWYAVIAGGVTVALCAVAGLLVTRRPQRVVVVHRIEGQGVVRIEETGQVVRAQEALVQWDRR